MQRFCLIKYFEGHASVCASPIRAISARVHTQRIYCPRTSKCKATIRKSRIDVTQKRLERLHEGSERDEYVPAMYFSRTQARLGVKSRLSNGWGRLSRSATCTRYFLTVIPSTTTFAQTSVLNERTTQKIVKGIEIDLAAVAEIPLGVDFNSEMGKALLEERGGQWRTAHWHSSATRRPATAHSPTP